MVQTFKIVKEVDKVNKKLPLVHHEKSYGQPQWDKSNPGRTII